MTRYNFIEIGTCYFNTEIQKADETTVGISVEPLIEYLDKLPSPPNVLKLNMAISDKCGEMELFYVSEQTTKDYNLPTWIHGCNRIGSVHPTVSKYLLKHGLPTSLIISKKIPIISVDKLLSDYNVEAVDYLKIDTEGHDYIIVSRYLELMKEGIAPYPKQIKFEANPLMTPENKQDLKVRLEEFGYSVIIKKEDYIARLE